MTAFEVIDSAELHKAFLELVHALHDDPNLARPELLQKIEPAFMIGLRTKDAELRAKFFAILQKQSGAAAARGSRSSSRPRTGSRWRRRSGSARSPTSSSPPPRPSSRSLAPVGPPARRPHPRPAQARRRRRRLAGCDGDARGAPRLWLSECTAAASVGDPLSSRRTDPRPVERRGRARALGARVCARVGPAQAE